MTGLRDSMFYWWDHDVYEERMEINASNFALRIPPGRTKGVHRVLVPPWRIVSLISLGSTGLLFL